MKQNLLKRIKGLPHDIVPRLGHRKAIIAANKNLAIPSEIAGVRSKSRQ